MSKACITPVFQRQMEQMRNIKNLIFDNDAMGELPPLTRLLFAGLWTMVDDKGRMEDNPRKIKKVIMGFDDVRAPARLMKCCRACTIDALSCDTA